MKRRNIIAETLSFPKLFPGLHAQESFATDVDKVFKKQNEVSKVF